jgi:hypothetical protein
MHSLKKAGLVCLLLISLVSGLSVQIATADAPAPQAPPPAAKPPPAPSPAAAADSEAVAKHAKRMACLKSAKDQKLVGPQKTAFLKDCIGST